MPSDNQCREGLIELGGRSCYRIPDIDQMPPFLLTVVSPADHWLYISSAGGLAAGRVDATTSLFPYRTDDLLHRVHHFSGPWTGIRTQGITWEPITGRPQPSVTRDLARSVSGDQIHFIETHQGLGLCFTSTLAFSEPHGMVRTVKLQLAADAEAPLAFELLDGIREIVPANAPLGAIQSMSCLINAYTRAERVGETRLATFAMESALSDLAEPAESLHSNVAWSVGLPDAQLSLAADDAEAFARGEDRPPEHCVKGQTPAYLLRTDLRLEPGESIEWSIVTDVHRSQSQVNDLRMMLEAPSDPAAKIKSEINATSQAMDAIIADTDGLQCTGDGILDAHHRMNTLFNDMRGGIFADATRLPWGDWVRFVEERNTSSASQHRTWLDQHDSDKWIERTQLLEEARNQEDLVLERLALEYLPLWFGRRHGDPSRPWNAFNIRITQPDGGRRLTYEGNWRDIFQNWEALLLSHPTWCEHIIAKFLNASTPDGFNPYRITREGIDWEIPEANNAWSNIGYWGDHQVSYLTRLLESARSMNPELLSRWLDRAIFTYADVPYRLASHEEMVSDPRRTISFDWAAHEAAVKRAEANGADGRMVHDANGDIVHVTMAEKLLVPVLAKLSSFVPDGGVWMNTQRPEWNDANNALAGYGLSMVTAGHLRRHLGVLKSILAEHDGPLHLAGGVADWLAEVNTALEEHRALLDQPRIDDASRRTVLDQLGCAFEKYRGQLPADARIESIDCSGVVDFLELATAWLDHAIAANRRDDGLYHGYNLVRFGPDTAEVLHLPQMLEGQMAILSSGSLGSGEAADLLEKIFESDLHRADLGTFLLYPPRDIPSLLEKGIVSASQVENNPLLATLLERGDTRLIERDADGVIRFASVFRNRRNLEALLEVMAQESDFRELVAEHGIATLELYEDIFQHHAFTGRSGGMYGYEGIGCTYWHMVAKFLLAAGECFNTAVAEDADSGIIDRLAASYHRIRDGLGFRMNASTFGALPIDAYSHTPADRGAQQPGMTGQVKEELITRRFELGVEANAGSLRFSPRLIRDDEWLSSPTSWSIPGGPTIELPGGSLGFQCCGVPVIYHRTSGPTRLRVQLHDGEQEIEGGMLEGTLLEALRQRNGQVRRIDVDIDESRLIRLAD